MSYSSAIFILLSEILFFFVFVCYVLNGESYKMHQYQRMFYILISIAINIRLGNMIY